MKRLFGKLLCWVGLHPPVDLSCVMWANESLTPKGQKNCRRCWSVLLTILLTSTIWSVAQAHQPLPNEVVTAAALRHEIPPALLDAVWHRECSRKVTCALGLKREWGPFQIRVVRASEAGCRGEWWVLLSANADCAARILAKSYAKRGRWLYALSKYNGCRVCKKPTLYAQEVYRVYLSNLVYERIADDANLLARR